MSQTRHELWLEMSSAEYACFKSSQFDIQHEYVKSLCTMCWSFLTSYEKKAHRPHKQFTLNNCHISTEKAFLKVAYQHGKLKGGWVQRPYERPLLLDESRRNMLVCKQLMIKDTESIGVRAQSNANKLIREITLADLQRVLTSL